uniref:Adenosinetriphosphatase n=1 Tax=Opuntia streptacantha TaxID=393608 RepID=A0A7C9A5C6_OPUST
MDNKMATAKSVISTIGSVAAATMVARTIINDFLPHEIHDYLFSTVKSFFYRRFSSEIALIINEYDGLETNQIFEAAELYLGTLTRSSPSPSSLAHRLRVSKPESEKAIQVAVDQNEEIVEEFEGVKFTWVLQCHFVEPIMGMHNRRAMGSMGHEVRAYNLTFHKKHKDFALEKYLPHVLNRATLLKQENKTIKLFTVDFGGLYVGVAKLCPDVRIYFCFICLITLLPFT